jgi:hypothetical protein
MKDEALDPADHITIEGEGRDEWGHRFFKFAIRGSDRNVAPFSAKEIMDKPNALFGELTNAGANIFQQTARNKFLRRLDALQPQSDKFRVVTRLGWNSGAFVLPNEIVGQPSTTLEPSFRHLDRQLIAKYRIKGSLEDWQRTIGGLCSGNSRLMFCASLGFTGPILRLVSGPRSGGFQLFGSAESGKTAAAMVTGSIWGCHRSSERRENGFAESWHTTAGKIELTALAHNETVLVLDEAKRAGRTNKERAQAVLDISFGLAENVERERLTNLESVRGWRFYFLSTSNYSLDDLAQRGNCDIDDAERGRFVDIPNPNGGFGIYEELHGFADGQTFTDKLKIRCRKFYGAVAQEFLGKLVHGWTTDQPGLQQFLNEERLAYLQLLKAKAAAEKLKPLNRASGRFAKVFVAGSLAIKYEIFPWKRDDLLQAILSCQLDGLRRTKVESEQLDTSISGLRNKLVRYLREHHQEFMNLDKKMPSLGKHTFGSVPGYLATFKGKKWLYLTADQLTRIIGRGGRPAKLKKELVLAGMMASTPSGKFVVQRPIFSGAKGNKGYGSVHAFRLKLLKDCDKY